MAHRELGFVEEQAGRFDETLAAFEVVASYQVIPDGPGKWTGAAVGSWGEFARRSWATKID